VEGVRITGALILLASASFAAAQSRPISAELGAYFPSYRNADFGKDVGVAAALGYSFFQNRLYSANAQLRTAAHVGAPAGGRASGFSVRDTDLFLSELVVTLRHRHPGTQLFTGLGIGVGHSMVDPGKDRTEFLVSGEVGYNIRPDLYVVARYQTARDDAFRAVTVSFGFRL